MVEPGEDMWAKSLLSFAVFFTISASAASLLPDTYRAKKSPFYSKCKMAKDNWLQFQKHIHDQVVVHMPKTIHQRVDAYLLDTPDLSEDETLGAFSADFIALALGKGQLKDYLPPICRRLSKLFETLNVPFQDRNADLIASFLTFTILNINNPAIYSAFHSLALKNEKNELIFEGETAGLIEYVVVTLSIASTTAAQILNQWSDALAKEQSKNALSWWQRRRTHS